MADRQKLEPLTTRIPKTLGNKLRVRSAKDRKSIQEIVTKAIEEYLAKGGRAKSTRT